MIEEFLKYPALQLVATVTALLMAVVFLAMASASWVRWRAIPWVVRKYRMSKSPLKVGDHVKVVRTHGGDTCGLRFSQWQHCRLEEIRPVRHDLWEAIIVNLDNGVRAWCYGSMLDCLSSYRKGDMVVRSVLHSGQSREHGLPPSKYAKMGLDELASTVLGRPVTHVAGSKHFIEGPDFTILTVGVAQQDQKYDA